MTLDQQEGQTPPPQQETQLGNAFLIAGVITLPCTIILTATTPMLAWIQDVLLLVSSLALIVGLIAKEGDRVADRTITFVRSQSKERRREHVRINEDQVERDTRYATQVAHLAAQISQLAVRVDGNNEILRQLAAAPTVRLNDLRGELDEAVEGVARVIKAEALEETDKRFEELARRFDALGGNMALAVGALADQIQERRRELAEAYVDEYTRGIESGTVRPLPRPRQGHDGDQSL